MGQLYATQPYPTLAYPRLPDPTLPCTLYPTLYHLLYPYASPGIVRGAEEGQI